MNTNKQKVNLEPNKKNLELGVRINKYLSQKGIATRNGADELIKQKKVKINGKIAILGDRVKETDKVTVLNNNKRYIYLCFNKPKGVVTSNPQGQEKDILSIINLKGYESFGKIFPIGRLDKESEGLIILTNDGRVTDKLLNPNLNHEKEYIVELDRSYSPGILKALSEGVDLGDFVTKKTKTKRINEKSFSIILTEGKNRQIRRMTEKLGFTVRKLKRIRIQNIKIQNIKQGTFKEIRGEEKELFLKSLGIS